jgi:hypothetical protein
MTTHRTDPLLLAGKVLILIIQSALAIGAAGVAIALPAIALAKAGYVTGVVHGDGVTIDKLPMASLSSLLLIGLGVLAILFVFFGRLRAIIDSVGDGDPFIPENARRLNLMAWLLLATQVLTVPMALLAARVVDALGKLDELKLSIADDGFNLNGILMVLLLFILARVFRQGASLREDLEGTV